MSIVYTAKDPRKELLETAAKIMAGMYSNNKYMQVAIDMADKKNTNHVDYMAAMSALAADRLIKHVNKYFNK